MNGSGSGYEVIEMQTVNDDDCETNECLRRRTESWSRKHLSKVSSFFGSMSLNERSRTLSVYRRSAVQKWKQKKNERSEEETCVRISDPAVLENLNSSSLYNVTDMWIEDSDGSIAELPHQLNSLFSQFFSFKLSLSSVRVLPPALFHSRLKKLDLSGNSISSINGIEEARNLEVLQLRDNHLHALPDSLGGLTKLVELDVSKNKLKDIPNSLGFLQNLEKLELSYNKIKSLPDTMGGLKKLKFFNVSGNLLLLLSSSMAELSSLEDFQASSNQLSSLSFAFESLTNLKSVLLSRNNFRNLPVCLARLPRLEIINMKQNRLELITDLLSSVKTLVLDDNQLTEIPKAIIDSPNIEYLWLRNNRLTKVTEEIRAMKNLRALHLSDNFELRRLPISLLEIPSLVRLSIENTAIRKTDEVLQKLGSKVSVYFENGQMDLEERRRSSVVPEMLKVPQFDSYRPTEAYSCGSVGKKK